MLSSEMTFLPILSGRKCIAALEKIGYRQARQKGSHVRLVCERRAPVTVPLHATVDRGTLRSILRTVEITVEEFVALLD
jgi:predicted RNA binding protein YcfA (HicA-like mRNA interferase family)